MTDDEALAHLVTEVKRLQKHVKTLIQRCRIVAHRNEFVRRQLEAVRQRERLRRTEGLRRLFDDDESGMVH